MKGKNPKINDMARMSLMAAMLCVIGPVTIPVGMVPVSLLPLALYLLVYVLGMWRALGSCLLYICIGMLGIPVFSGYAGGPGVLLGPTGGYLSGYLFLTFCSGLFIEHFQKKLLHLLGMLLGILGCYLTGTLWLAFSADMTFYQALLTGVAPFVLFDVIKIAAAITLGPPVHRQLKKADML